MSNFKLQITSVPIFIKEYLDVKKLTDIYYFYETTLKILNNSKYESYMAGNREIYKTTIYEKDNDRFVIDIFFTFFQEKLERTSDGYIMYEKELGLMDTLKNELFEFLLMDEYGDTEKFKAMLYKYDNTDYAISFMKI